jgi:lysophospholipase
MDAASLRPSGTSAGRDLALAFDRILVEGMRVRVAHGSPASGMARGTVVILTGRAEFIEKYEETFGDLLGAGFAVAAFDWRGQGGSERFPGLAGRGHVTRMEDYLVDFAAVLDHLEHLRLPRPWLMLGHSLGGHVGLRHLAADPGRFAGAVLSAPMFGINLRPLPRPVATALCRLVVGMGAGSRYAPGQRDFDLRRLAYERNRLTTCPERFADLQRRVEATPELAIGGVTYHWLAASLRSIELIHGPGFPESVRLPILVCQAGDERLVCNGSIAAIARRLPQGRLLVFPEARHELMREREPIRRRFIEAFLSFADEVAGQ